MPLELGNTEKQTILYFILFLLIPLCQLLAFLYEVYNWLPWNIEVHIVAGLEREVWRPLYHQTNDLIQAMTRKNMMMDTNYQRTINDLL